VTDDVLADEVVDGLQIEPGAEGDPWVTQGRAPSAAGDARAVLEAFVTVGRRRDALFLLDGAAKREARATNAQAFAFAPGSRGGRVVLEVGAGESVEISEAAFYRLIGRWRAALGSGPDGSTTKRA
jgi:hypothetical protein